MFEAALGGVSVVGPVALHPLQIGQARAIDELVDHAGRHEVGEGAYGHWLGIGGDEQTEAEVAGVAEGNARSPGLA